MAARPISSSVISFGLVSLPVKMYTTSESGARISFNMIHEECGTRLKQQYICQSCDVVVPREDRVKGYEFTKGQYVLFDDEELKALESPKSNAIEITEFVPADRVQRLFMDKMYYLGPDKGGARAYRLLSRSLQDTGRVAIAKYAARGKEYLVAVRPYGEEGLAMEQLRYADEVKSFEEVEVDAAEVRDAELELAKRLIEQSASEDFDPEQYTDEVREQMMELIQAKIDGDEISTAPAEEPAVQIIDLMEALKASLDEEGKAGEGKRKPAGRAGKKGSGSSKAKKSSRKKAASG